MHKKQNTRPPDLFGIKFTGPKLKSLASGLRSSVKFEPCPAPIPIKAGQADHFCSASLDQSVMSKGG